jgi:hypothetical protein
MIENFAGKYSVDYVKQVLEKKGYAFFTNGVYNLNIIGIRNPNLVANSFDDTMVVIYKFGGEWITKVYPITTDAGTYWLKNPLSNKGTAILVPNQYRGVYSIDLHNNKYYALCQRNGKVEVYRDNDKDVILDMDSAKIEKGMFGINIHRSNPFSESLKVDKFSAGCQVFKRVKDFNEFMEICQKSKALWGNSFSYTLIKESDLL